MCLDSECLTWRVEHRRVAKSARQWIGSGGRNQDDPCRCDRRACCDEEARRGQVHAVPALDHETDVGGDPEKRRGRLNDGHAPRERVMLASCGCQPLSTDDGADDDQAEELSTDRSRGLRC